MRLRVGVGHRVHHVQEEADARVDGEVVGLAVAVDAVAVDVLQHQEGLPHGRDARVHELGDVRVAQAGQDRALAAEAGLGLGAEQAGVEELDRGHALEASVTAVGQPDGAHAALADGLAQRVGADRLAGQRGRAGDGTGIQEALLGERLVHLEQRLHVRRQGGVERAQRLQPFGPRSRQLRARSR